MLLPIVLAGCAVFVTAAQRGKQQAPQAFAIIGGTVFRESGLAFPGVEVMLTPATTGNSGKSGKSQRQATDARGEFAFRVSLEPMRYKVTASAKHFVPQEKTVEVRGEERTDVTLMLSGSSNK